MSLMLLFPLGLTALAAWALPLLLHLVRREQQTPTDFAALRWLAIRAKPRQRLRFDEVALLLARLALIAAFAALLARPAVTGGDDRAAWEVFHPALPTPTVVGDDGIERRWLADGFPPVTSPRPAASPATASLLRQLDAELPAGAGLAVHVPTTLDGLDGERPRLSRPVAWRVAAGSGDDVVAAASTPSAPAGSPRAPTLVIRHDDAHADDVRWLRAAARAWRVSATADVDTDADSDADTSADAGVDSHADIDVAPLDAPLPARDGVVLAWLAAGPLPAPVRAWVDAGGTMLLPVDAEFIGATRADTDTVATTTALGRGRVVHLHRALRPADWPLLLEARFPRVLRELSAAPHPPPTRGDAAAVAPIEGGPGFAPAPREFPALLVALVLALFALERWLATGRRAGAAA